MFVPLVSASYVCPAAYTGVVDGEGYVKAVHPSGTVYVSESGVCFTANATTYLYNVTFSLKKVGDPSGVLVATLREIQSGVVGVNAYPKNTVLEYSSPVSSGDISGSYVNVTFVFSGTYELQSASEYYIGFQGNTSTIGASDYIDFDASASSNDAGINRVSFYSSSWYTGLTEMYFIINGDTTEGTPTPTPAPTSSSTGDADMEALTAAILPWLVPLLVCLIPALLGYKFVGELGFFIGLNVGVILAYVTLASTAFAFPLWGIILVGVMDVAVVLMRR